MPAFALAITAVLALYNNVTNLVWVPRRAYVPVNLAFAAALVAAARWSGLGWGDLGVSGRGVLAGLALGGTVALLVVIVLGIGLRIPAAGRLYADKRVEGATGREVAWWGLVRIPLGTVVLEEVAFRGVLYGAWADAAGVPVALAVSGAVFGIWHIGPSIELVRVNRPGAGLVAPVAGAVLGTAVGGAFLCLARIATDGIVGPALVHAAVNSTALGAAFVWRRTRTAGPGAP